MTFAPFLLSSTCCPRIARVASSEELGTMSKNNLRRITLVRGPIWGIHSLTLIISCRERTDNQRPRTQSNNPNLQCLMPFLGDFNDFGGWGRTPQDLRARNFKWNPAPNTIVLNAKEPAFPADVHKSICPRSPVARPWTRTSQLQTFVVSRGFDGFSQFFCLIFTKLCILFEHKKKKNWG